MDQMLPSPGFSIPSIGTPLHQPEEDQQILPNALQQQMPPLAPMGGSNISNFNSMNLSTGLTPTQMMGAPQKTMHTYLPFQTPQSLMQPQTPVRVAIFLSLIIVLYVCSFLLYSSLIILAKHDVSNGSNFKWSLQCSTTFSSNGARNAYDTDDTTIC